LDDPGPPQDFDRVDGRDIRQLGRQVGNATTDQFDQIGVDLHFIVLVKRPPEIEGAFDFAAPERRACLLAKRLFIWPQIVG
jgi:hypothetical protein